MTAGQKKTGGFDLALGRMKARRSLFCSVLQTKRLGRLNEAGTLTVIIICEFLFQIMTNCKLALFVTAIFIIHCASSEGLCVSGCHSDAVLCRNKCTDQPCANICTSKVNACFAACPNSEPNRDGQDNDDEFEEVFEK